jgi:hypothetical protein
MRPDQVAEVLCCGAARVELVDGMEEGYLEAPVGSLRPGCRIEGSPFVVFMTDRHERGDTAMWDSPQTNPVHLSHDLPCQACGHAAHTYLPCSDACTCVPAGMPGAVAIAA